MANFSFNKPEGAVYAWDAFYTEYSLNTLRAAAEYYGFEFDLSQPMRAHTPTQAGRGAAARQDGVK